MNNIVTSRHRRPTGLTTVVAVFGLGVIPIGTVLSAPNFLVIVGDDMGAETLSCHGLNDDTASRATLRSPSRSMASRRPDRRFTQPRTRLMRL